MTTLKEAYESVGEKMQLGDLIENSAGQGHIIKFLDGWYFDFEDCAECIFRADTYGAYRRKVFRNCKQIYPKVEDYIAKIESKVSSDLAAER